MHALIKVLLGAVLLVGSVFYIYSNQYGALTDFLTVINGTVPAFLALIGVFIIWLELDEWKIKRQMKK